jgi:hypothetical protein
MASCGSAAQRRLWSPVALQPSACYGLLWLCSLARAMACCGSAAQRRLWPPVALQPSAGYGLLWLYSPERAMASCGCTAQRWLWPPEALQPSAGYGLLWLYSPARTMASLFTSFRDHTQRRATVGRTPLDVLSAHRRDLYLTTHATNIHTPSGIRTHDRSRRAAVDLHLRPCGHWDGHINI